MGLKGRLQRPYFVLVCIYIYFILYAIIMDSPAEISKGLIAIILSRDVLITDYVEIAGIGASLINSAVINLLVILYLIRKKVEPKGATIMVLWLLAGFSFFGKNLFNIWPVLLGGYLYAKVRRECFSNYAIVTLLATSLSPAVSQLAFNDEIPIHIGAPIGLLLGVFIGFIMSPISDNSMHSHHGYNLYNVGFASGIVAMMVRVVLQGFGVSIEPVFIWNTTSTTPLTIFLIILFSSLIIIGLYCGVDNKRNLQEILKQPGRLTSDFYSAYGDSCYINMGILGLLSTLCVVLIGGHINGPVMGGIFTVAGFGCFGKHIKNTVPVMIGCLLGGALLNINNDVPSAVLAVLFGTCLAPIAGTFGWYWGIIAGFLHINISMNIGEFTGGINLYNNGLAGGLTVMFLLPLIREFKQKSLK